MKGLWTAPYREEWKAWDWPIEMEFRELYSRPEAAPAVLYANPNAHYVLRPYPELRLVVTPSTGETHLDRAALEDAGVEVLSLLDNREGLEGIRASSEFTFLLILNALRRLDKALGVERDEEKLRGHELYSRMVGLIGRGRIGKNLERWLMAFGAGAYWNDPHDQSNLFQPSVEWIFRSCHVIVLCCALTGETRGFIGANLIRLMRPAAILVNTARGEVLDEDGVAAALVSRPDIGYWTDVLAGEATGERSPLADLPNVHVTPHIAGTTYESQEKAALIALGLTKRWLDANK